MTKQWVQHISGQGEKWLLVQQELQEEEIWVAHRGTINTNVMLFLPKSEYRLCDPPKVWKDVTKECEWHKFGDNGFGLIRRTGPAWRPEEGHTILPLQIMGYQLRKLKLDREYLNEPEWAFIVEQKVTE